MKKLVIGLLFAANIAGASCVGPYCWDDTGPSVAGLDMTGAQVSGAGGLAVPTSGIRITSTETISVGVSTPTAAGYLGIDSSYVLYISTGTGRGAWVKIGGQ